MPKARYGKVCRRDVSAIRNIVKTKMRSYAKEWAEAGGGSASAWWTFLSGKLKADVHALPVTCG